jgi:hypothetical protein
VIFVTVGGEARAQWPERGRGIPLSGNSKVCIHARPSSQGGLDIRRPTLRKMIKIFLIRKDLHGNGFCELDRHESGVVGTSGYENWRLREE